MENLKKKKKSGKNKNKLRTIYPESDENFKNSKPRVQFYWFLFKKKCKEVYHFLQNSRLEDYESVTSHVDTSLGEKVSLKHFLLLFFVNQ